MNLAITNAFSISMLPEEGNYKFKRIPNPVDLILSNTVIGNAIGHPTTDTLVRGILESGRAYIPIWERVSICLGKQFPGGAYSLNGIQGILVAQYSGPRLPEGATVLPEGAKFDWWLVTAN